MIAVVICIYGLVATSIGRLSAAELVADAE